MFDKIAEQFQHSFKPVGELTTINAKALEQLAQQQTALFTGLLNDGVACAESMSKPQDVANIFETQKAYAEGVQEKLVAASRDAYAVMSETQEQIGDVLKSSWSNAQQAAAGAAAKATKPAAAKTTK